MNETDRYLIEEDLVAEACDLIRLWDNGMIGPTNAIVSSYSLRTFSRFCKAFHRFQAKHIEFEHEFLNINRNRNLPNDLPKTDPE